MRGPFLPFAKRRHRGHTFLKRQLAIQRSYLKVDALPDDLSDRDIPQICPWPSTATAAQEMIWNYREPEGLSHAAKTKAREV
jgi:hypothetical protein